jgi:hypothetical protein
MKRSVTETLVAAMEEAGPAKECIVVMTTEDGNLIWLCTDDSRTVKIGLLGGPP